LVKDIALAIYKKSEDFLIDYGEIGLDALIFNDAIRELPIIKTVIGFYKGALSIRELHFAKKLYTFAKELHSGNVPPETLAERLQAAEADEKWLYKEVEGLIIAIDRLDREYKAKICAQLYIAYLNKYIKNSDFEDLLSIVERWLESDTSQLLSQFQDIEFRRTPHKMGDAYMVVQDPTRCGRLVGLGIMSARLHIVSTNSQIEYVITQHGAILAEILKEGRVYTDYYKPEREASKKTELST